MEWVIETDGRARFLGSRNGLGCKAPHALLKAARGPTQSLNPDIPSCFRQSQPCPFTKAA